ncbi:MAG: hybrid sensor histidine kinase/response regulator [Thermodesulfobacteriota bacterium]
MIEDQELRNLFRSESEEHIQQLEQGFLHLEKEPGNEAVLEEVLREAHSLKGAARMLGLGPIERIGHCLEDTLRAATQGTFALDSRWMDKLYTGLDAIKSLVEEAISDTAANVDVSAILAVLDREVESSEEDETTEPAASPGVEKEHSAPSHVKTAEISEAEIEPEEAAPEDSSPATEEQSKGQGHRLKTIRVQPRQLDELMTQSGELVVTKTGINQRLREMESLIGLCQEWFRDQTAAPGCGSNPSTAVMETAALQEQPLSDDISSLLEQVYSKMYEDSARLDAVAAKLGEGIRRIRMLPLSTLFNLFPRMVHDISKDLNKNIDLIIEGGDTTADKHVIEEMKDPLMHIIRNAIHHGIEPEEERRRLGKPPAGTIRLKGYQTAASVVIEVLDDGRGLNLEKIKAAALKRKIYGQEELNSMTNLQLQSLIFTSGLSTQEMITDISGRGVGLDVVRSNVEAMKGKIEVTSRLGKNCTVRTVLPLTMATTRVILIRLSDRTYGIPVEFMLSAIRLTPDSLFSVEGRKTALIEGEAVSVESLAELLELPVPESKETGEPPSTMYCVVIQANDELLGLLVDSALDVQEVVLKPSGAMLHRVRNVAGSTILGSGEVCMILNPHDLIRAVHQVTAPVTHDETVIEEKKGKHVVLLAEDSITTRIQEQRILEGAGYQVLDSVDGLDAYGKLSRHKVDAVVTDIEMPNMNGLELTKKIRQDKRYSDLPVILVTTLSSDDDKRKGLAAGANAYIKKAAFEQSTLLDTLKRLI